MDYHHSSLELVEYDKTIQVPELAIHDETVRGPERDWDATAFELDTSVLAPQVVIDNAPELFLDESPPEVDNIGESTKERAPSTLIVMTTFKWYLMLMVLIVAVAIAIGVGVGIWRHRQYGSRSSSIAAGLPAPHPIGPNITSNAQYILNDTSLAALILPNEDRQLFFSGNNGSIRRAIFTSSTEKWTVDPYIDLSVGSKLHTPLAVNIYNQNEAERAGYDPSSPITIGLHYVSENHAIVGASYNAGVWTTDLSTENWSAAVDTRSLSYILIPDLNTTDFSNSNLALLFYENPTTKISLLLQQSRWLDGHASALTEWVDITGPFHESDTYPFSTPFIYTANLTGSGSHSLVFYTPGAPGDEAMIRSTYIAQVRPSVPGSNPNVSFFDADLHGPSSHTEADYSLVHRSDIATFGTGNVIWINGTQPLGFPLLNLEPGLRTTGTPTGPFPFARLASVTSQSLTYLYHQINGTTFAEETWDDTEGSWGPTQYIHVTKS